jgi:methionine sulfoxide reductase heme-binding subunit
VDQPVFPRPTTRRLQAWQPWLLKPGAKLLLFITCLGPVAWLFYGAWANILGANPAEALIRSTGDWTLRFLCVTLAITPLRQSLSLPALLRFRRMLGLFAFFYASLHFLAYGWLDKGLEVADILKDIAKRPFILVGSLALLLLLPLAATSFNRAIRTLGVKRWQLLHRLVYGVVLLGLLHFFWMRSAKNNLGEVAVYAVVVAVLLGWRIRHGWRQRQLAASSRHARSPDRPAPVSTDR